MAASVISVGVEPSELMGPIDIDGPCKDIRVQLRVFYLAIVFGESFGWQGLCLALAAYRILKALSSTDAAHCAQILLTINVAAKHAEKPDEGNLHVRFCEGR